MRQEEETKLSNIYQILTFAASCLAAKEEELLFQLELFPRSLML